jgi:hypothetical protein
VAAKPESPTKHCPIFLHGCHTCCVADGGTEPNTPKVPAPVRWKQRQAMATVLAKCTKLAVQGGIQQTRTLSITRSISTFAMHSLVYVEWTMMQEHAERKPTIYPPPKKIVLFPYRKSGTRCQNPILIYRSSSQQLPFIIPTLVPFGTPERSSVRRLKIVSPDKSPHQQPKYTKDELAPLNKKNPSPC